MICDEKSVFVCVIILAVEQSFYWKGKVMEKLYGRTVGERIRILRESKGLRQEDLAEEFLLSSGSVVSLYESGKRQLPSEMAVAYSKKFGVSTDWILMGEEAG